jgi:VanZ family protein
MAEESSQNRMISFRAFRYWFPVLLWMGFIFWMSTGTFSADNTSLIVEPLLHFLAPSITPEQIQLVHGIIRKSGHVTEYFILGVLSFRAFRGDSREMHGMRWGLSSLVIVLLYATGDEFHQSFVSTRTASLFDVGFDALGGILAQAVSFLWPFRGKK